MSLRVRKIERTRLALIDAAVDLCLSRGYDNTTVEQIAAACDVSSRTFSRYFNTKEAVFVAVLDDFASEVALELRQLDSDLGPLESMRVALRAVLTRAHESGFYSDGSDRITRIISVVTACDALRQAAIEYRGPQVVEAMAHRMNVTTDDQQLTLAMTLISVTVVHSWGVLAASDGPRQPLLVADQIDQSFIDLATYAADITPGKADGPS